MSDPAKRPEQQPELGFELPPPRKRRRSKLSDEYSDLFLAARELYPSRDGSNPWDDAWRQWKARLKQGHTEMEMLAGTQRYARWCAAKGRVGTEFVMQACRFYGRSAHFLEPWGTQPPKSAPAFPDRPDPTVPRFTKPHTR